MFFYLKYLLIFNELCVSIAQRVERRLEVRCL